jgi:hypothetical protein
VAISAFGVENVSLREAIYEEIIFDDFGGFNRAKKDKSEKR